MSRFSSFFLSVICVVIISSCTEQNKDAQLYLESIEELYNAGKYDTAKTKIDSLKILYPKAFDQLKGGMALLQKVRKAQSLEQIAHCDSLILSLQPALDEMKAQFIYDINKDYQETGRYLPKGSSSTSILTGTNLRSGVNEDGQVFIESVFIGGNQFHSSIIVSTPDSNSVESLPVFDEGLNFRFNDSGKQYEVIKFMGESENGIAKFIYLNKEKPLTVTLHGKDRISFNLSDATKKSIAKSYILSTSILKIDSLKLAKEKAQIQIKYLEEKKDSTSENQ